MSKILRIVSLFLMLLVGAQVYAQNQATAIKGTVTDDKAVPLPGATVTVKGTPVFTVADINGKYSIEAPAGAKTLVFTFIGMDPLEVAINGRSTVNATLTASSTGLSDVVVIGYGTQKRTDATGAISSVSAKELEDVPMPSVDQMLEGRAAGVTVTQNSGQPGSATSVHIRGLSNFHGSEPLYVIDGVAIQGGSQAGDQLMRPNGGQDETTPSPLAQLNPDDIESIDVLKDASATAIYGSRAANGVIIITTKHGKAGQTKINYDFWYGLQSQGKFLDMMNLPQYANFENQLADDFGLQRRIEFADPSALGPGTNWQDAIFVNNAPEQSHTLSFSGGKDGNDYYVSAGYFNQDGTILGSHFNRFSVKTTLDQQIKSWFKVGETFTASQSNEAVGVGNVSGVIYNALLEAPDAAVYNADGTFAGPYTPPGGLPYGGPNPVQQALNITNTLNRTNVGGNIYGDINFTKDLSLHSEIDGNFDWNNAKTFLPTYSYGATGSVPAFVNSQAQLQEQNLYDNYWNWVEHLNYNHTFGKHAITAMIGHEVWESTYDGIQASTKGFTAGNTLQTLNLGTQSADNLGEPIGSQSMESLFARANYTFDNKYSLTFTERADRSSNFAQGHQVGYFPSAAAYWRISDEPFMANVNKVISNLKLRIGYGEVGNSNIGQYKYGSSITPVTTGLGTGFSFANFSNPNITWETDIQKNIGLDFSLLNNRIDASVDVYDRTEKNFLFQQPLPAFLGGGTAEYSNAAVVQPPYVNAGSIENKGIDISITSHNINTRDFKWSTTVIFSHYTNTVTSLNGFPAIIGYANSGGGAIIPVTRTQVGGPIGEFYGYKIQGIITTQAELSYLAVHPQNVTGAPSVVTSDRTVANGVYLGDLMYYGENNNGNSPNQQYALGNPNPDFTYGITNTFSYKEFSLTIFLNGSYGGKILNALDFQTEAEDGLYTNQLASVANYWTPQNPNSTIPAPRATFGNNNLVMSDRFLESASFLRIQNVRLDYNLPVRWAKYVKMSSLKVFASGQNLYVFTKYSGLDPEVGSLNQDPTLMNVDNGRYPIPRVVTMGLNAQF